MPHLIQRIVPQENLLIRPRVSFRVSELIFEFVNERVLEPQDIMQSSKFNYTLVLAFHRGLPSRLRNHFGPYNTPQRIYLSQKGFTIFDKTQKIAHLSVYGEDIDEKLSPQEYSRLVFEMLADFLLNNFKSVRQERLEQAWAEFNFLQLDQFQFPASFEEQRYVMDQDKYMTEWSDFLNKKDDRWILVKDQYKERYGF
jgi:hypothetical protein